jgi:quercetin dioxygenase-like cupin family protein
MKLTMLASVIAICATPLIAQEAVKVDPPTETQGVSVDVLEQNGLKKQIKVFKGYDLRARRITFAPGATFALHDHAERPGFVIVESGTIVEGRGEEALAFSAGQTWIEDAETKHWLRNVSDQDAVIIMVDLPPIK